jgi:hypothetical protein
MDFLKRIILLALTLLVLQSCNTDNVVVDTFEGIPKETWSYINPIKASLTVSDSTKAYNIYVITLYHLLHLQQQQIITIIITLQ